LLAGYYQKLEFNWNLENALISGRPINGKIKHGAQRLFGLGQANGMVWMTFFFLSSPLRPVGAKV